MKNIIHKYSSFVSNHALFILITCLCFTGIMLVGNSLLKNKSIEYEEMLPENYDSIKAFKLITNEFGSTSSGIVVLEIQPSFVNSNENQFICNPEVVRYSKKLEDYLKNIEGVQNVNGIGKVVYDYYGRIPNSEIEIKQVCKSVFTENIVSKDESLSVITLTLDPDIDSEKLTKEVNQIVVNLEKPQGVKVALTGEIFASEIVMQQIGPSMTLTSNIAMIAIVLLLFLLFKNIKSVILPLMTIIFGVLWTMGFMGLIGKGISTMTSGTISMIMGVGIDFGIQIMSRFNYEFKRYNKKKAMEETLKGTLLPIFTTALACLIGFKAMGLGELTLMAEIGDVMSYGIVFCMLAAITLVPSLLLLFTKEKSALKKS